MGFGLLSGIAGPLMLAYHANIYAAALAAFNIFLYSVVSHSFFLFLEFFI